MTGTMPINAAMRIASGAPRCAAVCGRVAMIVLPSTVVVRPGSVLAHLVGPSRVLRESVDLSQ